MSVWTTRPDETGEPSTGDPTWLENNAKQIQAWCEYKSDALHLAKMLNIYEFLIVLLREEP
jgi:hypothetical protein